MFEWDPAKSAANLAKHGIDFETATALWLDEDRLMVAARSETEPRFAVVGTIAGKHWTVFATMRDPATRIISARRSRDYEVEEYEHRREAQDGHG